MLHKLNKLNTLLLQFNGEIWKCRLELIPREDLILGLVQLSRPPSLVPNLTETSSDNSQLFADVRVPHSSDRQQDVAGIRAHDREKDANGGQTSDTFRTTMRLILRHR
eukprot:258499_1